MENEPSNLFEFSDSAVYFDPASAPVKGQRCGRGISVTADNQIIFDDKAKPLEPPKQDDEF
jgi:hypothetical protein